MRIRDQFTIQLVGGVANTLLLLILTPILIRTIGMERYGVLLLVLSFVIYVGLADLGLGAATTQKIASSEKSNRSEIFGAALCVSVVLGIVAGSIFSLLSFPAVSDVLGLSSMVAEELAVCWPALFLLGVGTIAFGTPQGALQGTSRFAELNAINLVATASTVIGPAVYALCIGFDLSGLLLSVALGRLIATAISIQACVQGGLTPSCWPMKSATIMELLGYGSWQTLVGVLHRAVNSIDRVIIGALQGATSVPIFAVPQGMISRTNVIAPALMAAVFPRLAQETSDDRREELVRSCYRSLCLLTPFYVAAIGETPKFLSLWLGDSFAGAASAAAILLAVSAWFEMIGCVPYGFMVATAKLRRETMISSMISLPNLAVLFTAVHFFGASGAAFIAAVRSVTFLGARVIAIGFGMTPLLDLFINGVFVIFAAAIVLIGDNSWISHAGVAAVFVATVVVAAFRRPTFVDELISQRLGQGLWRRRRLLTASTSGEE